MSWVLEHLQIIIAVAGAIAYWLNQRKREKKGEAADYDGNRKPENRPIARTIDRHNQKTEEAERARRIQEEIRRKIAERRGQGPAHPSPAAPPRLPRPVQAPARPIEAPRPIAGELPEMLRRLLDQRKESEAQARAAAEAERADRERQRQLQEQAEALEKRKRVEAQRAARFRAEPARVGAGTLESSVQTRRQLLADVADPASLRRAMVLKEILGPPVGLR